MSTRLAGLHLVAREIEIAAGTGRKGGYLGAIRSINGIRVGFLCTRDPRTPGVFSGAPFGAWTGMTDAGLEVVNVSGGPAGPAPTTRPPGSPPFEFLRTVYRRAKAERRQFEKWVLRPWDYTRTIRIATRVSSPAQAAVDSSGVDILFSMCVSTMLYALDTDIPMVYASDTTAKLINETYPRYIRRSQNYHRACDEIERTSLHKCAVFASASECTARSAEDDYGLAPSQIRVVEFGANVVPEGIEIDPAPPEGKRLELVLVAADPRRKRLGFCIEVAEKLKQRGWGVTLNYVGPRVREVDSSPLVAWHGRLMLNNPIDRRKHMDILRRSHWMLLPSEAEAYGIAPCEAAHFGRPSAVSNVGGLSTVVRDAVTGLVLAADASADAYADAIERVSADPERYRAMSEAALHRAHTVLSWAAFGERMKEIFTEILEGKLVCRQAK